LFHVRFAVTTPRGVELDKDILLRVHDNVLVVLCDNGGDGAIVLLGDWLALDAGLNLAGDKVIEELGNGLLGNIAGEGELLVLLGVLDGKGGPLADLEVQVAGVLAESLCINGGKVNLTLDLLGNRLERFGEGLALFRSFGEDVSERDASLSRRVSVWSS